MAKPGKKNGRKKGRRKFLQTVALGAGTLALPVESGAIALPARGASEEAGDLERITYPRVFQDQRRKMIGFPLGGVGAGSIYLGGRGQLTEWWIFNRPDKGRSPEYAFPSIWVQSGSGKPVARVLEAQIMPPYGRNPSDLGSANVPGLPRLASCAFTGEYPLARIDFEDPELPVQVSVEAFTPFIPLDADDSGLPLAVLRYHVSNPGANPASVAIAWAIDNPVGQEKKLDGSVPSGQGRQNDFRQAEVVQGLLMQNPFLAANDPQAGTVALSLLRADRGQVSYLRGWTTARWWESPLLYWQDFSEDGNLGPEATGHNAVASLCLNQEIPARGRAEYTFLLTWHFPNRTPKRCGWKSPKGHENDVIGNYYCTRFKDAWEVAEYAAHYLPSLEARTRKFVSVIRNATLPDAVRDAATANLSTLATPTTFRTTDGAFHGFEGCNDQAGCCFGSCTHVYAYEPLTAHLFPSLSRSLREQQFGFSTNAEGLMDFREMLPYGIDHYGIAAADGQMACIVKLYLDWRLSGDTEWLRQLWPGAKRALEFAWIKGGWDANRDGVMEGVQHNTYDVEFFGPNPFCGIWYLAGLRAGEEMAKTLGDTSAAEEYHRLFRRGSEWIDAHLFNGEYYIQNVTPIPKEDIAKGLLLGMGTVDTEHPTFQLGEGCLADQLMGQYFAHLAALGLLVERDHLQKALRAVCKYNYKRTLENHACVQRVYALNAEAGLVVCDYPRGQQPDTPFPYFAEVWSGIEYAAAALMIFSGMAREGVEVIESVRRRFDGEKRNPWNEAECGYHYARPMSAWAPVVALSGFQYHGAERSIVAQPRINQENFISFWSTGTGWGSFSQKHEGGRTRFTLSVVEGKLPFRTVKVRSRKPGERASASGGRSKALPYEIRRQGEDVTFLFKPEVTLDANDQLLLTL